MIISSQCLHDHYFQPTSDLVLGVCILSVANFTVGSGIRLGAVGYARTDVLGMSLSSFCMRARNKYIGSDSNYHSDCLINCSTRSTSAPNASNQLIYNCSLTQSDLHMLFVMPHFCQLVLFVRCHIEFVIWKVLNWTSMSRVHRRIPRPQLSLFDGQKCFRACHRAKNLYESGKRYLEYRHTILVDSCCLTYFFGGMTTANMTNASRARLFSEVGSYFLALDLPMSTFPLLQGVGTFVVGWLLWKTIKQWVLKSPLDNIPGPPAVSFVTGVFGKIFNNNGWAYHKHITETFGSVIKIRALFGENELFIYDPKVLHHVFVKDQHIFEETDQFIKGNGLFFGQGLLGTLGEQHRKQRKMLNPVFSIAHMREMLPTFFDITYKLRDTFQHKLRNGPQEIEVLSWMTRTALELIGQSGLGYSFDDLTEESVPHPFSLAAKALVPTMSKMRYSSTYVMPMASTIGPAWFRRLVVDWLPWKNLHDIRDIVDTLHNTSVEIFEHKKKALEDGDEAVTTQIGRGKDIMSILIKANMSATKEESLTRDELLGQMSTLIFAAMDTTTSALARLLWLMATHQDVQDKLRAEIKEARGQGDGEMSYDQVVSLPYLDAICRETLRLHSPVSMARRIARQDVVVPLYTPIKGVDGQEIKEIHIPRNTTVTLGLLASNTNPELWGPDANEWKPERWLEPLPDTVSAAHLPGIYSNLMTFIGGSRACIGFKFSQLEMKVVLILMIESFRFSPTKDEIFWQMTGITTPIVAGSKKTVPHLPLIVERV